MDKQEIQEKVVSVVCRVLNIEEDIVEPESNFIFDLGAESTQSVQLVVAFEEAFGIEMDDEAALQVQTVGEAVNFIGDIITKA